CFQDSYDNSGLQTGIPEMDINSALLTIDITEKTIDEALTKGCNLIISHHPLIFSGLKRISTQNMTERILYRCIHEDIAVYSAHTNLDSANSAVSRIAAEKLGLTGIRVLSPLENKLMKLVTYIPEDHVEKVRQAIFEAGAGVIGNYDQCGFTVTGQGSFRGNDNSDPFVGEKGKLHFEKEVRLETVLFSHLKNKVVKALIDSHPYEEVAYDLYSLSNNNVNEGLGCIGSLSRELDEKDFLLHVEKTFSARGIRYSALTGKRIKTVALCGGSGSSLITRAVGAGADAFITADIRYHSFFEADNRILLIDAGHYETEKFATEIIKDLIIKKFPKFALRFSETNTNPINYL
ncbi:MAG TPA: Nif3-like dinuclear metal center hexameric protein, partial [Bacteroidales bacterium]|nr:Nif3-like dinuclear metal center hexameric protein [Bacteroidales bacterium]